MMMDKSKGEKWMRYIHELGVKSKGFMKLVVSILKNEENMKVIEESENMEKMVDEKIDVK